MEVAAQQEGHDDKVQRQRQRQQQLSPRKRNRDEIRTPPEGSKSCCFRDLRAFAAYVKCGASILTMHGCVLREMHLCGNIYFSRIFRHDDEARTVQLLHIPSPNVGF